MKRHLLHIGATLAVGVGTWVGLGGCFRSAPPEVETTVSLTSASAASAASVATVQGLVEDEVERLARDPAMREVSVVAMEPNGRILGMAGLRAGVRDDGLPWREARAVASTFKPFEVLAALDAG